MLGAMYLIAQTASDLTQGKADFAWGVCDIRLLMDKISCEIPYNHPAELYVLHLHPFCC